MDKQTILNILTFLGKAQLEGKEALVFMDCIRKLNVELDKLETNDKNPEVQ